MAATVLNSDKAVRASKLIVDVFVSLKGSSSIPPLSSELALVTTENESNPWVDTKVKLRYMLDRLLETVVNPNEQTTVREEAQELLAKATNMIKAKMDKVSLENEHIAAETLKTLAEIETEKAIASKTQAEADSIAFATIVRKIRLVMEAQKAIDEDGEIGFIAVLEEFGKD